MPPQPTGNEQKVVIPGTTRVEGVPNYQKLQAVQVNAGEAKLIKFVMRDLNGDPVDLTDVVADGARAEARIKEVILYSQSAYPPAVVIAGTIPDPTTGEVNIQLTSEVVTCPGISWIEIGIIGADGALIFSNKLYLCVNRSLWGNEQSGFPSGPPSLPEIRLAMRDSSPVDNLWLGVEEFDLAEVIACIERPIGYWNESPPPIPQRYNTANFPYRYYWMGGVVGCLYQIAEHHYIRTHLPYQAGGISIDDKNKFGIYGQKGKQLWDEYKNWVQWKKVQLNCENAVMSVGSQYYGWSWTR
jgi:hypothetical protein